jgi:hypothetical protein
LTPVRRAKVESLVSGGPAAGPGAGKKAKLKVEYGLLTDPAGCTAAARVLPGDPPARPRSPRSSGCLGNFELSKMVMVGDRGMITGARINALRRS